MESKENGLNAWMASIKNHPLWWFLLVEYIRRKNKQPHGYVTDITGPHAFTEVIHYYMYRYPSILLHSFKPIKFYPVIPLNKNIDEIGFNMHCI